MGAGRLTALAALALALALAGACAGPRVRVSRVATRPGPPGFVRVEARLRNEGGAGEVKVTARLVERASGRVLVATHVLDVEAKGEAEAVVDVPAPDGAFDATVTAVYPPD